MRYFQTGGSLKWCAWNRPLRVYLRDVQGRHLLLIVMSYIRNWRAFRHIQLYAWILIYIHRSQLRRVSGRHYLLRTALVNTTLFLHHFCTILLVSCSRSLCLLHLYFFYLLRGMRYTILWFWLKIPLLFFDLILFKLNMVTLLALNLLFFFFYLLLYA